MSEWKNVKIGDICRIVKGTTGIASAEPGEYPLVVTAEERKTCSSYQFDCEAVCIPLVSSSGYGKKSLKYVHYQSGKFALGTILCAIIPNNPEQLDARFLHQYLQFYKDTILVPLMKGAANVSLSMKDIATVEIPLPPIENQRELSDLFITLQENQKKLAAETEKQFEYTKLLRQNILQDAIEGKLTAYWRNSHPVVKGNPDYDAEALFEKIQKEKVADKKQKILSPITDEEKPFEIPEGWKWVRLGEIIKKICAGGDKPTIFSKEKNKQCSIPVISNGEINDGIFGYTDKPTINESAITISGRGTIGYTSIRDYPFTPIVRLIVIILENNLNYYFFKFSLPFFLFNGNGSAIQQLTVPMVFPTVIPLPPLKEQEEIVTKVENLLAKVTELETQIQERKILSEKLAFGIIKEKLEG